MNARVLTILIFALPSYCLLAQEVKSERETFIVREAMPSAILDMLDTYIEQAKKLRYISEHDGQYDSYEVKFDLGGRRFSIEFSKDAELEDVEVDMRYGKIPALALANIDSVLRQYQRHKVQKVQKQFSSEVKTDAEVIFYAVSYEGKCTIHYEIEVSVKSDGHWNEYEMLFDLEGKLVKRRQIVRRESDFILFR